MSRYEKMEYTKPRRNFGKQPLFQMVPGQILDSIAPCKDAQKEYILRSPVHRSVQATLPQSVNESNTPLVETREQGIDHSEGGWPRDVHPHNEEHVARYRRRVMHDDGYVSSILNVTPSIQHCLNQNNAIEMYETYFANMNAQEPVDKCSIRIANVFRDRNLRPISCVTWTHEKDPKLAVSYCFKTCYPDSTLNNFNDCNLWDIHIQTKPIYEFRPDYPCWKLACSPVDPRLIICGLEKGTVNLFDVREGLRPVSSSEIYNSHREPITSILFIYSRTNSEFFTGSTDGQCIWWDTRNLSMPLDRLPLSIRLKPNQIPDLSNAEGISSLEYDYGFPTRFLSGTESGLVISVNRMGKSHSEVLSSYWKSHDGPVRIVQRSICTSRMFLTCGDYTVKIWAEEIKTGPIVVTKAYKNPVTYASWAPLRPSCYMSICAGGRFYYWDLLRKYKEPITTLQVSKHELTIFAPCAVGESVAIGDSQGTLYLLQLSENLVIPRSQDKARMFQIYERETRREHILDNRLKEVRLKARVDQYEPARVVVTEEDVDEEEELRVIEEEYFRMVREQHKLMGGVSSEYNTSFAKLLS